MRFAARTEFVTDLAQVPGQLEGGGPGGERDRGAGRDQGGRRPRDRFLLPPLQPGLHLEARLVAARHARQHGTAVHFLDQAGPGEYLQVTADSHVRDAEPLGQVADPCAARAPHLLQDERLPVLAEHLWCLPAPRTGRLVAAASRRPDREDHMFVSGESCSLTSKSVCSSLWHHGFVVIERASV